MSRRTPFLLTVALAMVAAACSRAPAAVPTTVAPTTTTTEPATTMAPTTTVPPTTTTTEPAALSPLNGVPVEDEALLDRRVMAIKIDNHPNARPQSGLLDSDLVIEEEAEGGITRFIALFLQSDSENLGPMRSVRPTDIGFLSPLGATLGYSGGQGWIRDAVAAAGIPAIGETRSHGATWRISSRFAPHNLYVSTPAMRQVADELGYPDEPPAEPLLPFGRNRIRLAQPVDGVHIEWENNNYVDWVWDPEERAWLRSQQGAPHTWINADGEEAQIAVETLLVLEAPDYIASGSSGSPVPATETTGEGRALVFNRGRVVEGTWSRENLEDPFQLEVNRRPLRVPPGEIWFTMHTDDEPLTIEQRGANAADESD